MRINYRGIFILLALFPLILFSQDKAYSPILKNNKAVLVYNGVTLRRANTLEEGLELYLKASSISEDSLTYNSTAQLVTGSSGVNVTIDGSNDVVIGNSVRFGSPTTGTIYQIVDTGASAQNLVLDQTFTGSVSDEFYWGGINTWYDESGNENNLTQTTAVSQPKLLWYGTDSASVYTDGVNDFMNFTSQVTLQIGDASIFAEFQIISYKTSATYHLIGGASSAFRYVGFFNNSLTRTESNTNTDYWCDAVAIPSLNTQSKLIVNSGTNTKSYLDNVLIDTRTPSDFLPLTKLSNNFAAGNFKYTNIYIWERTLSDGEINALSK
jgi:hypothetical protein